MAELATILCAMRLTEVAAEEITKYGGEIDPPRSWTKDEKLLFRGLPIEVKAVIARRERDRETTLRRMQNEVADMKKRLEADAETKAANGKEPHAESSEANTDPRG